MAELASKLVGMGWSGRGGRGGAHPGHTKSRERDGGYGNVSRGCCRHQMCPRAQALAGVLLPTAQKSPVLGRASGTDSSPKLLSEGADLTQQRNPACKRELVRRGGQRWPQMVWAGLGAEDRGRENPKSSPSPCPSPQDPRAQLKTHVPPAHPPCPARSLQPPRRAIGSPCAPSSPWAPAGSWAATHSTRHSTIHGAGRTSRGCSISGVCEQAFCSWRKPWEPVTGHQQLPLSPAVPQTLMGAHSSAISSALPQLASDHPRCPCVTSGEDGTISGSPGPGGIRAAASQASSAAGRSGCKPQGKLILIT